MWRAVACVCALHERAVPPCVRACVRARMLCWGAARHPPPPLWGQASTAPAAPRLRLPKAVAGAAAEARLLAATPLATLLFGYYINLVPYQLITRSKCVRSPPPAHSPPTHTLFHMRTRACVRSTALPNKARSLLADFWPPLSCVVVCHCRRGVVRGCAACARSLHAHHRHRRRPTRFPPPLPPRFVYHYIPALIMGIQLTALMCDAVLQAAAQAPRRPAASAAAAFLVAVLFTVSGAGFVYWALPWAYGLPLDRQGAVARKWLARW